MKKVRTLLAMLSIIVSSSMYAQLVNGSLPILIDLHPQVLHGSQVILGFTVLQKVNAPVFDVERSNDGRTWQLLFSVRAQMEATAPSSYQCIDLTPLKGINFYRVVIRGDNAHSDISLIRKVHITGTASPGIFPNPAAATVTISLSQVPFTDWTVRLLDDQGRIMLTKTCATIETSTRLDLWMYPPGVYQVEIDCNQSTQTHTLLINH